MTNHKPLSDRQNTFADLITQTLKKLPEESATRKRLISYQEIYNDAVEYLSNPLQKLAFIGNIGVGKTTALSYLMGLLDDSKPILSTGSGRTTICEVEISYGDRFAIEVQPYSEEDIRRYLRDFSIDLHSSNNPDSNTTGTSPTLSREIERALRNILDLQRKQTPDANGGNMTIDAAEIFANDYDNTSDLEEALLNRARFHTRQQTRFFNDTDKDPKQWLKNTFKSINSCTHPDVALPQKIIIRIPDTKLKIDDFMLSIIDTKGIDETVNRTDIDACLHDAHGVSILCGGFNDAPSETVRNLLRLAKNAGLDEQQISQKIILLILDKKDEAAEVMGIDEPVGDKGKGRDIRLSQIKDVLRRDLQLNNIDIHFFDAKSDNSVDVFKALTDKAGQLRQQYTGRLEEIEAEIEKITHELHSQSAQQAKSQISTVLADWIKKSQDLSPCIQDYFEMLMREIQQKHPSTIRASINRKGGWKNLDFHHILASACRAQATEQIGQLTDELTVLINNMLSQDNLQPAYALLKQLKQITDKRKESLYQIAFDNGRSIYQETLQADDDLWKRLGRKYGEGYRESVSNVVDQWFRKQDYRQQSEQQLSQALTEQWKKYINEVLAILAEEALI